MEIVIKTKKREQRITRDKSGGGIIRVSEEACDILEGIADKLNADVSIKDIASTLIKEAANNAIIKEEEEE
jgi:hypothetical protein|nr:MAG TPA: hypothetical protein [Caudoviricetes sp.]